MPLRSALLVACVPALLAGCDGLGEPEADDLDAMGMALAGGPGDGGDSDPPPPNVPIPPALHRLQPKGFWLIDPAEGSAARSSLVDGIWRWPVWHDLKPATLVHFIWVAQTAQTAANVAAMADRDSGWTVELRVNGSKLRRDGDTTWEFYTSKGTGPTAFGCPDGKTCLGTSVKIDAIWFKARPWQVDLTYRSPRAGAESTTVSMTATTNPSGSAQHSYFGGALMPTFRHSNCSTCHSLGSAEVLVAQHGPWSGGVQVVPVATPSGHRLTCAYSCHDVTDVVPGETFDETEWMTPAFDQGLDFSVRTSAQICAKLKQRLPTADAVIQHFTEDARIAWAVHDGEKPFGLGGETAWPHSYDDFAANVYAWVGGGMPCPAGP